MNKKLTWVLAHEPYQLFHKAAFYFADKLREKTNGEIDIEVLDLPDYNARVGKALTTVGEDRQTVIDLTANGDIDISTVYVNSLAAINKDLFVWDMPFLFNNISDASEHLDGEVGQSLLRAVSEKSNLVPLTYTFSGGFRLMPSTKPIAKLSDFAGLKVGSTKSPVSMDTFRALGADPVEMNVEDLRDSIGNGTVDCGETTYPRFFVLGHDTVSKYINDTTHNVFLTCIITNKDLFGKLTKEQQELFFSTALEAAAIERKETVDQVIPVQQQAAAMGIQTIKMSAEEKQKCIDATRSIYEKYDSWFSPGILKALTTHKLEMKPEASNSKDLLKAA